MSYRWYYTDVAADGWTAVVIFMLSPVFSPRKHAAAVNVALYRDGKSQHWAFSEYQSAVHTATLFRIGQSSLHLGTDRVRICIDERSPFQRRPLHLELTLQRLAPSAQPVRLVDAHHWHALMPRAEATLTIGNQTHAGLGYHDTNWGDVALDRERWTWTRAHEADRTWIHYAVKGEASHHVIAQQHATTNSTLLASRTRWKRSGWGLTVPLDVAGQSTGALIESSPFYARLHTQDEQSDRLTEVAHFARFQSPAFRWMPYFRSRSVSA